MAEAEKKDEYRKTGAPLGILHGLPVAMKDIIDTAGIPTENGTVLDSGRVPNKDASVVSLLKAAGAIILGKTASTELAFMKPAKTRNPVNPAHTPGGSSAGSAAAVAAKLTPLALGTQTAGSVIRPASYCGAYGFKPSFGRIPRSGILTQSPTLDTVGMFAMAVEDLALLGDAIFDHDPEDETTPPMPPWKNLKHCLANRHSGPVYRKVFRRVWRQENAFILRKWRSVIGITYPVQEKL